MNDMTESETNQVFAEALQACTGSVKVTVVTKIGPVVEVGKVTMNEQTRVENYLIGYYLTTDDDGGPNSSELVRRIDGRLITWRSQFPKGPIGDEIWARITMGLVRR